MAQSGPTAAPCLRHDSAPVHGLPPLDGRLINCYLYVCPRPLGPGDPEPLGTEPQPSFEENHATWDSLWLPQVQSYLARWEAFDRDGSNADDQLAHLDAALIWLEHCWEIHSRLDFRGRWPEWCQRVLGWAPEQARELVVGESNKSLEGDAALRELASIVRASNTLPDAFARPVDEVLSSLPEGEEGAQFRAALATYLDRFGRRSDNFADVSFPTWQESPLPVIALIKMYAAQQSPDAHAEHAALLRKRDAATDSARDELATRSAELVEEFDRELGHGRRCAVLNEDHNYWLDQQTLYWVRLDLLAAGRLLAERRALAERDDVFFLTLASDAEVAADSNVACCVDLAVAIHA